MRNERGLTLVELLAVLVIFVIIMALIATVLINGTKVSDRSATNQTPTRSELYYGSD